MASLPKPVNQQPASIAIKQCEASETLVGATERSMIRRRNFYAVLQLRREVIQSLFESGALRFQASRPSESLVAIGPQFEKA